MALIAIFDIIVYAGATKVIEPGLQVVVFCVQHGVVIVPLTFRSVFVWLVFFFLKTTCSVFLRTQEALLDVGCYSLKGCTPNVSFFSLTGWYFSS